MLVTDANAIINGSGLSSVDIIGDKVQISVKNGATLTLTPVLSSGIVVSYQKDFLNSKENKRIDKLQKKIKELEYQIAEIKESNDVTLEENEDNNDLLEGKGEDENPNM